MKDYWKHYKKKGIPDKDNIPPPPPPPDDRIIIEGRDPVPPPNHKDLVTKSKKITQSIKHKHLQSESFYNGLSPMP
jgi:hypothetical protein